MNVDLPEPPRPAPRADRWRALGEEVFDVCIVGGGVTGAGLALDLSLRGLRVAIVDRGDWCGATSSASSRLIHGGLRYLEHYEFALVRESCLERARLMRNAAGLVWPETFAFPIHKGDRVGLLKLAAGLLLYTGVSLPVPLGLPGVLGAKGLRRRLPQIDGAGLRGAGTYLDGATDDARLGLANLRTAWLAGATGLSHVEAKSIQEGAKSTAIAIEDREGALGQQTVQARAVALCGGPFTENLRSRANLTGSWIAATRGSHILVPREKLPTEGASIFTSRVDGRAMFLIPWPDLTAIGTTDLDADPNQPQEVTPEEVDYLLESANRLMPSAKLTRDDVVSQWVGLRPLLAAPEEDPSARSREERVVREGGIYTIAGGKLTGYRSMAEQLGARIAGDLVGEGGLPEERRSAVHTGRRSPTREQRLVGALDRPVGRPAWSKPGPHAEADLARWARERRYGRYAEQVARAVEGSPKLDVETHLAEVDWAWTYEDCRTADDFLFRRTDAGYRRAAEVERYRELVEQRLADLRG
jgi:glycerol-3-phosphate dehydrogenase